VCNVTYAWVLISMSNHARRLRLTLLEARSERCLFIVGEPPDMCDQGPKSLPGFLGKVDRLQNPVYPC
jgi:hypothetical protein